MGRFIARQKPGQEDHSLYDTQTGRWHLEQQGFGVCDRVADSLNAGQRPTGEIGELVDDILTATRRPEYLNLDESSLDVRVDTVEGAGRIVGIGLGYFVIDLDKGGTVRSKPETVSRRVGVQISERDREF